jgi:imidazole glycerol phosphate synthase glutamine amidotransferase subunit
MATQVEVVDYGGGNVGSLLRALERLNIAYTLHDGQTTPLTGKAPIILPGVGAFGAIMSALHERQLVAPLTEWVGKGVPFLGVCVGLQVLFDGSEESPEAKGLGLLAGQVVSLKATKVPQIGWNGIESCQGDSFRDTPWPEGYVYYVNSYVAQPTDPGAILYTSQYEGQTFCGAVRQDNITAFQFHPEKSGAFGHSLLQHWYDHR